jgi:hypothetical protein
MSEQSPIAVLLQASVELAKQKRLILAQRETIAILFERNRALARQVEQQERKQA